MRFFLRSGFTILELLIAIVLLVGGTLAILRMFSIAMISNNNIENSMIALNLAQEEMENIKDAANWEAIDSFATSRTGVVGTEFSDFEKEVAVSGDPKYVNVVIFWNDRGDEQSVELATLFTNYGY